MSNETVWSGLKAKYTYYFLASLDATSIKAEAGNYIFAKPLGNDRWGAVYIGIAENLRNRLPSHEQWEAAKKLGATHVWAHVNADASARAAEEKDLIAAANPPLNVQHRTIPPAAASILGRRG